MDYGTLERQIHLQNRFFSVYNSLMQFKKSKMTLFCVNPEIHLNIHEQIAANINNKFKQTSINDKKVEY